jgi:uncharacterized membrane protein
MIDYMEVKKYLKKLNKVLLADYAIAVLNLVITVVNYFRGMYFFMAGNAIACIVVILAAISLHKTKRHTQELYYGK